MATMELDTVTFDGMDAFQTAEKIAEGVEGVDWFVVTEEGPGGGHPVISWQGDVKTLAVIAAKYAGIHGSDLANLEAGLSCIDVDGDRPVDPPTG